MVFVLVACRTHFGGMDAGSERVDAEFEVAARHVLDAAVRRIGVRAVFVEVDACRILHKLQVVGFVCADRAVEFRRVDGELAPVEVSCCACGERQHGIRRVQGTAVDGELDAFKVLDVARRRIGLDVQGVACIVRLVAAMDRAGDVRACGEAVLAVAEVDGVARGLA